MKKILLIIFLIPLIGHGRIIPKTTNDHNPGIGANTLISYEWFKREESQKEFNLAELYLIFGGDIHPNFNSMIYISIAQQADKSWGVDPTTAIIRTTSWEDVTLMGGRWFIDIGQHNPYFTFQFPFVTQPELITQVFGPNALIGIGIGVDWKLPFGWYSEIKMEASQGENETFFGNTEDNYLADARWENTLDLSKASKLHIAASYGRAEGKINVWGADFRFDYVPTSTKRRVLEWVGEYLSKDKAVAGFYTHLRSQVGKDWWLQYRFDYTGLEPDRTEPISIVNTGLLAWVASDKLALRLEYSVTNDGEEKDKHSAQFQLNMGIGSFSENTY